MNPFRKCSEIEKRGLKILLPYARLYGTVVEMAEKTTQKDLGDFSVRLPQRDESQWIECKVEQENKHGNFFLETWSNRSQFNPGWLFTTQSHRIWYYFLDSDELYNIQTDILKQWAWGVNEEAGNVYRFTEKRQKKTEQLNDTWGRCVPIKRLTEEGIASKCWNPKKELERWNVSSLSQPTVALPGSLENSC